MKGESAKLLCEEVARLLQPFLPADIHVAVRARAGFLAVRAIGPKRPDQVLTPDEPGYASAARSIGIDDGSSVELASLRNTGGGATVSPGIGTWIPFLPRTVRARLNALDALETIQNEVANALGDPWPGPETKAYAEVVSDVIVLCFKNGDGSTTGLGSLPISDCL